MSKSVPAVWRDAIRDDLELDRTAALVGFVLSTYMDGGGLCWPRVETIAAGAKLSRGRRAVQHALKRLEERGYLAVDWSQGKSSHRFSATLPTTAHRVRSSEWSTAHAVRTNRALDDTNRARRAHEDVEDVESGAADGASRFRGAPAACEECEQVGGRHLLECSKAMAA